MKVLDVLVESQSEYIPRDRSHNAAASIARQLVGTARTSSSKNVRGLAYKLANRFHSDVLAAIDDELEYVFKQKPVDEVV